jgi:hypothetical protein
MTALAWARARRPLTVKMWLIMMLTGCGGVYNASKSDERDMVERIMDDWGIDGQLDG